LGVKETEQQQASCAYVEERKPQNHFPQKFIGESNKHNHWRNKAFQEYEFVRIGDWMLSRSGCKCHEPQALRENG